MPRKKKKKKKEYKLTCNFCKYFNEAEIVNKIMAKNGKIFTVEKKCIRNNNEIVSDNTPICKGYFEPHDYIYCKNYDRRIPLLACLNRLNNRTCVKCKLKKYLIKLEHYIS